MKNPNLLEYEQAAELRGFSMIAGVDEAGRGPLAGPVVAGAVILPPGVSIPGLTDSKQLSSAQRDDFFTIINHTALGVSWAVVEADVIDRINILQASLLAMLTAVKGLATAPGLILVDGNQKTAWTGPQMTIVKGDSKSLSIAAASVIAKVTRDRIMQSHALTYPQYGFDGHKGYGCKSHREAIKTHGPCPIHRMTFRGVKEHVQSAAIPSGVQINLIGA
jgi:ribonuclease HII